MSRSISVCQPNQKRRYKYKSKGIEGFCIYQCLWIEVKVILGENILLLRVLSISGIRKKIMTGQKRMEVGGSAQD